MKKFLLFFVFIAVAGYVMAGQNVGRGKVYSCTALQNVPLERITVKKS